MLGGSAAGIVILADVVAVAGAIVLVRSAGIFGLAFGITALVAVHLGRPVSRITPSLIDELPTLAGRMALPALGLAALFGADPRTPSLIRTAVLATVLLAVGRSAAYAAIRTARTQGLLGERTVIVGAGPLSARAAETLLDHPEYGMVPVGVLDDVADLDFPVPLLGGIEALEGVIREYQVRRVVVAFGAAREADIVPVLRASERTDVDVHFVPRFFELGHQTSPEDVDDVWGLPLVQLRHSASMRAGRFRKRTFDLALSLLALPFALPVMALVAFAVRVSSPGPVLFRQERVGEDGRSITVWKFRSMRQNTDSDTLWSVNDDARVTTVGRILRVTHLDELPQIFNVLAGEMSIVGPRPERPHFVEQFSAHVPEYQYRHRMKPGLTGWAQVHGLTGDTSIVDRARFDNSYIENWSLWRDAGIVLRTVTTCVRDAVGGGSGRPEAVGDRGHPTVSHATVGPMGRVARAALVVTIFALALFV